MKNKNKIIAIIVAVVLVASIFVVGTVANTKNTSITISIDKTELSAGQSATVTVTASADYPVATASIPVFYDKTLVAVSNATATLAGYDVANVTTDLTAVDSLKIYENTNISSSKFGFVLVTYIGGANDTVSALEGATILTFTITAKADVSGNAHVECITESAKTEENIEGMLYFGATTSGTTITSIPENVENIDVSSSTVKILSKAGAPELILKEEGAEKGAIVDTTTESVVGDGFIYGINVDQGETIENYFETPAGSVRVTPNESFGAYSTGAKIELLDEDEEVLETYYYIFFGDFNGDGFVDGGDLTFVEGIAGYSDFDYYAGDGTCESTAVDVNGDGFIDGGDLTYVAGVAGYSDFPAQSDTAAIVAANKGL